MNIKKKTGYAIIIVGEVSTIILIILLTASNSHRPKDNGKACARKEMENINMIMVALLIYMESNDGYLPDVDEPLGLIEVFYPEYLDAIDVFLCPFRVKATSSTDPISCGYHFNVKAAGRKLESLEDGTVILYEPWSREEHSFTFNYVYISS